MRIIGFQLIPVTKGLSACVKSPEDTGDECYPVIAVAMVAYEPGGGDWDIDYTDH
jgi:hypothetical protein